MTSHCDQSWMVLTTDYWRAGYELIQSFDSIEGKYNYRTNVNPQQDFSWAWGYGYGYSMTDGVVLIFRKRANASPGSQ